MAFRDNSVLITSAFEQVVAANGTNDVIDAQAVQATAFRFESGTTGDDLLNFFNSNDSIINTKKIFDGNGDNLIQFGPNGVLDIDRTKGGDKNAGPDQVTVGGLNAEIFELRYLGAKTSTQHVYADSATLKNLWDVYGKSNVIEGTVGNDIIDFGGGNKLLLVDNALGLNLGGDTLNGFTNGDLLVTTAKLFDNNKNEVVRFGSNQVLDVSAGSGPKASDPFVGPGGQLDFNAPDHQDVHYLGTKVIDGVNYYFYGNAGTSIEPMA